ncbi:SRPBCC family protein [Actinotalea caeni]|uniref:SRPBCC family protein n=1 Tax=Actinotalea caeni TaxID=1348467 RepID=UPI0012E0F7A3|nr:SRPBCC family protein [Actinotalea caeni]
MSETETRVATAERVVHAPAETIWELIADPARQPEWDGNDNLATAAPGQRVRAVGDVFTMTLTNGATRENTVVELVEGRRVAWLPNVPGEEPRGHLWRWELEPVADGTLVRHTYDWTNLTDPTRLAHARATTSERLLASIERLAALAEGA